MEWMFWIPADQVGSSCLIPPTPSWKLLLFVKVQSPTWTERQCELFLLQHHCNQPEICSQSNWINAADGCYKWWYSVMVKLYWVEDKWGITGQPSMRANATRFTPESITAKLNFTCNCIDYWRHVSKIKIYHNCHIYIFTQPCCVYTSHQSSAWRWL